MKHWTEVPRRPYIFNLDIRYAIVDSVARLFQIEVYTTIIHIHKSLVWGVNKSSSSGVSFTTWIPDSRSIVDYGFLRCLDSGFRITNLLKVGFQIPGLTCIGRNEKLKTWTKDSTIESPPSFTSFGLKFCQVQLLCSFLHVLIHL